MTIRHSGKALFRRLLPALLCLLLGLLLCALRAPAAWADGSTSGSTVGELQTAIESGKTSFTLTGNMNISDSVFLNGMQGEGLTLIVPENTTLEITSGTVELSGLELRGGTLNLHGGVFRVNRSFTYTAGSVHVYGCWNLFPAADVLRYDYGTIFSHERVDGDNTKLLFNVTTEEEFAAAVITVNSLDSNVFVGNIAVQSPLTMTGQHTITHGAEINFNAGLTMQNDSAIVYDRAGGTVFFNNLGGENAAEIISELHGDLYLNGINAGPGCVLKVGSNANVNAGQMNLGGNVELRDNCRLRINNKLEYNDGLIKNYGCFNVYLPANITRIEGVELSDVISFPEETGACNLLFNVNNDAGVAAVLDYAKDEMTERFGAAMNVCYNWAPTGTVSIPERTQIIISGNRGGSLSIGANCALELPERGDLVLDPNTTATINGMLARGGIIVQQSAKLEVNGVADFNKLTLNGGTVNLYNNCIFRVNEKLEYTSGTAEVLGRCFNLFPAADVLPDNTGFLSYADDTLKTNLLFRANNAGQFASALGTINELSDRFIADLQINGRCDLEGENIFRRKAEIRVNAGQGGSIHLAEGALLANNDNGGNLFITNPAGAESPAASVFYGELNTNGLSLDPGCVLNVGENGWVKTHDRLNIPAGAKLSLDRGQLQLMDNSAVVVEGELENNGFINMQHSSSGARLIIDGGTYSGVGRIGVQDTEDPESYFSGLDLSPYVRMTDTRGTQYILVEADLILPNDLTEIGDKAFADGSFDSVYLSPNVTGIADDAFAGVDGLTIYGFPRTAAQSFAEYWGYTFVPVA